MLETDEAVPYGTMPSYDGATPVKPATDAATFTFLKWRPTVTEVTGDVTYTAVFSDGTAKEYMITWVDGDGKTLAEEPFAYGETPVYTGATPTKTGNAQYKYTFNGSWSPDIGKVTGNATYTAQFDRELNTYTITWKQDDGSVIDTTTVAYGTVPTHANPAKAADAGYSYTFDSWTPELTAVTGDATYTAAYTAKPYGSGVVGGGGSGRYTLTFDTAGGEAIQPVTYSAYEILTIPAATRAGYDFTGWTVTEAAGSWTIGESVKTGSGVTMRYGDVTFTAQWQPATEPGHPSGPQLNTEEHMNYLCGYDDGTIRPNQNMTRAEAATMLYRLLTPASVERYGSTENDYIDVAPDAWYNEAVSTLSNADILSGYPDGRFRPDDPLTRAQLTAMVTRFTELADGTTSFTDAEGHWAYRNILTAEQNGWVSGYPDGTFRPDDPVTRAETVTILNRMLDRGVENAEDLPEGMVTFSDNLDPNAWYYLAIQEAANNHDFAREGGDREVWTAIRPAIEW